MVFNSFEYLIFFPIVAIFYFIIPFKQRWMWLLAASYFFYMCMNPRFGILIFLSTVITYFCGILIGNTQKIGNAAARTRMKNLWMAVGLGSNIGILLFFKYFNFLVENVTFLTSKLGISWDVPGFNIILPVGISFYTFRVLSYLFDIYRNVIKPEKHFGRYALFVSFFPQLMAGPIEKSRDILPQFETEHFFDFDRAKSGLLLMLWGYLKKVVIADRLAFMVDAVYSNPFEYSGFTLVAATLFFSFQLYCDFSGYSDIAMGTAQVMGFKLSKNFNSPILSKSTVEFYRKWHISLSVWFNDYLFVPLTRGKCTKFKIYRNIMIVWLTSGLWHGASWNFIIWGFFNGIFNVLSKETKPFRTRVAKWVGFNENNSFYNLFRIVVTYLLVSFSRIFFKANTLGEAIYIIKSSFVFNPTVLFDGTLADLFPEKGDLEISLLFMALLLYFESMSQNTRQSIIDNFFNRYLVIRWSVYFALIFSIIIIGAYGPHYSSSGFIYFKF